MKHELLNYLVCPGCGSGLDLAAAERAEDGEVLSGELACRACGAKYPVRGGIPRMIKEGHYALYEKTQKNFAFSWKRFADIYEDPRDFLDWIHPKTRDFFRGKVVLDAGCGTGKHAVFAAEFGAKDAIAFDLSGAVDVAYEHGRRLPNVHVVQADIYNLPFRNDFDYVYTIGVLQHLPRPEEGFQRLTRLIKKGGWCSIWVYGYEGTPFVRKVVDPIRKKITSRIPNSMAYAASFFPTLVFFLLAKGFYRPLAKWKFTRRPVAKLPMSSYFAFMSQFPFTYIYNSVFDQLIAPITNYFKREEIEGWFERAGLEEVFITSRNDMSWRGTGRRP